MAMCVRDSRGNSLSVRATEICRAYPVLHAVYKLTAIEAFVVSCR